MRLVLDQWLISHSRYATETQCRSFFDEPVSRSVHLVCLDAKTIHTGDILLVEEVEVVPVVKNVFTAAAELGQEASEQVVKIFKIVHLTSMEHNVTNEEEM